MEVSSDNFVDMVYLLSYMGRIEDAITNTIVWRNQFGITNIDTSEIYSLVEKGIGELKMVHRKEGKYPGAVSGLTA